MLNALALKTSVTVRRFVAQVGTYAIVGGIATVIDYAVFIEAVKFVPLLVANAFGWLASLLVAYTLHSVYTFDMPPSVRRFIGFVAVSLSTFVISSTVLLIASLAVGPDIAKLIAIVVTFCAGYALSRVFAFRPRD